MIDILYTSAALGLKIFGLPRRYDFVDACSPLCFRILRDLLDSAVSLNLDAESTILDKI